MKQRKQLVFYVWMYALIVVLAITGLVVNNTTLTLNETMRQLEGKLGKLEEENELLQIDVLSQGSLATIEEKALFAGMGAPKQVEVLVR